MPFPHDDRIAEELLRYVASQPGGRVHGPATYLPMAERFPELTPEDLQSRVPTGELRWENKIRFARQRLVERGLLYPARKGPSPRRGVWIITDRGARAAAGASVEPTRANSAAAREGIILAWNRTLWDGWPETYEGAVNMVIAGARYATRWSVGSRTDVLPGTDAWLLRQGGPFGLIGHGVVVSEPFEDAHFATPEKLARYIEVEFDVLLDEADLVSRDILEHAVSEIAWRHQFQSGNRVSPEANARLKQLWTEHIS